MRVMCVCVHAHVNFYIWVYLSNHIMYTPLPSAMSVLAKPSISYTVSPPHLWSYICSPIPTLCIFLKDRPIWSKKHFQTGHLLSTTSIYDTYFIVLQHLCVNVKLFVYWQNNSLSQAAVIRDKTNKQTKNPTLLKLMRIDLLQKSTCQVWWAQDRSLQSPVPSIPQERPFG